jgi:olefin beta-lactone synthetase
MTILKTHADLSQLPVQANVSGYLRLRGQSAPDQPVLIAPKGRGWTRTSFSQLDAWCDRIAHGLARHGLRRGDRACVLVPPGPRWLALAQGLWRLGASPVFIDPGMGRASMARCIERARPRAFFGSPRAHLLRLLERRAFASVEIHATVGGPAPWGGPTLDGLCREDRGPYDDGLSRPEDEAAVLFTSGATGTPKGAVYTHGMFDAQARALQALYHLQAGEVDLACFPLFALFSAALQWTSVLPDMDFSRPAACAPERIHEAVKEHGPTSAFGSPAIWRRYAPWCREREHELRGMRRILIAGAPVPPRLVAACKELLGSLGEVHTPYGATEALPVSSAAGSDLVGLRERTDQGEGNCVGTPAPGVDVRLIRIDDGPIPHWREDLAVAPGEPGEVVVRGPMVTREYAGDPDATRLAKIDDGEGGFWHRMGDVGRVDGDGRLWLTGRKAHRVLTPRGTVMPVGLENVFNLHERIEASAVVGVGLPGVQKTVLVVKLKPGALPREPNKRKLLENEILRVGLWVPACSRIDHVLYKDELPLDRRHNAKIDRLALAAWAADQLR